MRKKFLTFYDKIIIAALTGTVAFAGCCRKTYPEKKKEQAASAVDSLKNTDTLRIINDKFDNRVIVMYGVRPAGDAE